LVSTTPSFAIELELPSGEREVVRVGAEEYVLDAARATGLRLPSVCEQGWDIACAAKVLAGTFDHSDARRYYREDEEAGFALLCVAKPRSDARLRTHATEEMRRHRDRQGLPAPRGT
jgi:ferredoxin